MHCARSGCSSPEPLNVFASDEPVSTETGSWRECDIQRIRAAAAVEDRTRREQERRRILFPRPSQPQEPPESSMSDGDDPTWERFLAEAIARSLRDDDARGEPRWSSAIGAATEPGESRLVPAGIDEHGAAVGMTEERTRQSRGDGRGGRGEPSDADADDSKWACQRCTYLNHSSMPRCEICDASVPEDERPPDERFADTLLDYNDLGCYGSRGQRQRRRSTSDYSENSPYTLMHERVGVGVSTRGGASGGLPRVGGANIDAGRAASDAVRGSAIGAVGAGVLTSMNHNARRGQILASMLQGAVAGGVAGAALGRGLRPEAGSSGGRREDHGVEHDDAFRSEQDPDGFGRPTRGRAGLLGESLESVSQRQAFRQQGLASGVDDDVALLLRHNRRVGDPERVFVRLNRNEWETPTRDGMPPARLLHMLSFLNRRQNPATERRRASPEAIAALPEETLSATSLSCLGDDTQCCICLEDFCLGHVVTRLPCLHPYHTACIHDWLRTSGTCPVCKHRV